MKNMDKWFNNSTELHKDKPSLSLTASTSTKIGDIGSHSYSEDITETSSPQAPASPRRETPKIHIEDTANASLPLSVSTTLKETKKSEERFKELDNVGALPPIDGPDELGAAAAPNDALLGAFVTGGVAAIAAPFTYKATLDTYREAQEAKQTYREHINSLTDSNGRVREHYHSERETLHGERAEACLGHTGTAAMAGMSAAITGLAVEQGVKIAALKSSAVAESAFAQTAETAASGATQIFPRHTGADGRLCRYEGLQRHKNRSCA